MYHISMSAVSFGLIFLIFFRQRFSLSDSCLNLHTCKEHKYPSDRLVIVQRIQNHFGALNKCTFQSPSVRTCDMRMYRWMHFEHKVHVWLSSCGQRVNQSCPVLFCPDQLSPVPSTVASQSFMPSWNIYIFIYVYMRVLWICGASVLPCVDVYVSLFVSG